MKEELSGINTYVPFIDENLSHLFFVFSMFLRYFFSFRTFSRDDPSPQCLNQENIKKCDKEDTEKGWSVCTEVDFNRKERYRYCVIKDEEEFRNSCVVEETLDEGSQKCNSKKWKKAMEKLKSIKLKRNIDKLKSTIQQKIDASNMVEWKYNSSNS